MKKWIFSIMSIILSVLFLVGCHESYSLSEEELDNIKQDYLAENAYAYVRENYWINDVFSENEIKDYVVENLSVSDIWDEYEVIEQYFYYWDLLKYIPEEDLLDYVSDQYTVEEVFPPEYYDYESE